MENSLLINHQKNVQAVNDLYSKGWAVIDDYFPEDFVIKLLKEQEDLMDHGQFRLAGIGKGENFAIKPEIRSDKVLWMDKGLLTPLQTSYWQCMDELRNSINRRCYLGLKSFEAHFAMYPPGSYYLRHLDQFQAVKYRIVTVILYLNTSWHKEDGGSLRMYFIGEDGMEKSEDFLPLGGRLVAFISAEVPHEVMPTQKERFSITGWFRDIDF